MEYRQATEQDLISVWDKDIAKNDFSPTWQRWKEEYISHNKNGELKTFVAVDNGDIVAQITVVLKPTVNPVKYKPFLCNEDTVNMCAFRCDKEYEGQGHISRLVKLGEQFARSLGKKYATIGAEAEMPRNLSIYFHFGYTKFLKAVEEDDDGKKELVLYYQKEL